MICPNNHLLVHKISCIHTRKGVGEWYANTNVVADRIRTKICPTSSWVMDGWVRVLRPFNSISVISRRWKGEHERLCAMKRRLGPGRISPPAGFEPATPWSEVGSANRSATPLEWGEIKRVVYVWRQTKPNVAASKNGRKRGNKTVFCYHWVQCLTKCWSTFFTVVLKITVYPLRTYMYMIYYDLCPHFL